MIISYYPQTHHDTIFIHMRITDNVSVVSPSLIGRETELATLAELLNQTASGPGHIAYLAGEAGIGKSRLATEVKSIAAQLGFRIVQGRCFEQDRTFPYAPLVDLLRGFCIGRSTDELMESFGPTAIELVKIFPELAVYLSDIAPNSMLDPEQDK